MTYDENMAKNANRIAEQRIRAARRLQSRETVRRWKHAVAAMGELIIRGARNLRRRHSVTSRSASN